MEYETVAEIVFFNLLNHEEIVAWKKGCGSFIFITYCIERDKNKRTTYEVL